MPEVYAFRDRYATEWGLNLIVYPCPPLEATDPTLPPAARVGARKTLGLKEAIQRYGFTGILSGIRRDEEPTRAKERVFSPRDEGGHWAVREQPAELWGQYATDFAPGTHVRVHPLLAWTEADVWRYIQRETIPVVELYFSRDGMRYRSLGEQGITFPVPSDAASIEAIIAELDATHTPERAGRPMGAQEDESAFERLRTDGYM
jgi:sulfate adenylyltransferase subunit 2